MSFDSEVSNWKYSNFFENKNYRFDKKDILKILPKDDIDEAYNVISGWDNYSSTPLRSLNKLSTKLNLNKIHSFLYSLSLTNPTHGPEHLLI